MYYTDIMATASLFCSCQGYKRGALALTKASVFIDIRAARHQAAQAGAPPASPPPAAALAAAPLTPEGLRDSGKSNLDTLTISPTNENREEDED